jgi:hypothetical protein
VHRSNCPADASAQGQPLTVPQLTCGICLHLLLIFMPATVFAAQADTASVYSLRSAFSMEGNSSASLDDSGNTSECDSCSTCSSKGMRFIDFDTGKVYTDMPEAKFVEYLARDVSMSILCCCSCTPLRRQLCILTIVM